MHECAHAPPPNPPPARLLNVQVHCELALSAAIPAKVALYLSLDPVEEAVAVLERVARHRAQACMQGLVECGVSADRLFVTHQGGEFCGVDFIPRPLLEEMRLMAR